VREGIGNRWEMYTDLLSSNYSESQALDCVGLTRYCCRRLLMTHVDLIEKLLLYNATEEKDEEEAER